MADRQSRERNKLGAAAKAPNPPEPRGRIEQVMLQRRWQQSKGAAAGPSTADADQVTDYRDEAESLDGGAKAQAEQSLGADLSDVKVHQGPRAAAAANQMGAKAFAHGQDIVLGPGMQNSMNPVMAHELAHTAQQKGGSPGVAKKSNKGQAGGAFEVDADRAGDAMMRGEQTQVAERGTQEVACFEGGEHMQLGTEGFAQAGDSQLTVGGVTTEPGLFTALQGDFYGGDWNNLELDCQEKPEGVMKLLGVLKNEQKQRTAHHADPDHNKEPDSDGAIIIAEQGLRCTYLALASDNGTHFGEQSPQAEESFEKTASDNPEYAADIGEAEGIFGANVAEYMRLHMNAIKRAFTDGMGGKPADPSLAMDAGANHFLTDAFASGHMRTPRDAMKGEYQSVFHQKGRAKVDAMIDSHLPESVDVPQALGLAKEEAMLPSGMRPPPIHLASVKTALKQELYKIVDKITSEIAEQAANFGAKSLHDADNKGGLAVHNLAGDKWEATGDHAMVKEEQNVVQAEKAVAASATHTHALYNAGTEHKGGDEEGAKGGEVPQMPYVPMESILNLLPMVDDKNPEQQDWHWDTCGPEFKEGIITNMKGAIAGTVESGAGAIETQISTSLHGLISTMMGSMGKAGEWLAQHLTGIVEWLVAKMPNMGGDELLNGIMM